MTDDRFAAAVEGTAVRCVTEPPAAKWQIVNAAWSEIREWADADDLEQLLTRGRPLVAELVTEARRAGSAEERPISDDRVRFLAFCDIVCAVTEHLSGISVDGTNRGHAN